MSTRTLLVSGEKTFRITVPDGSKITFGPWSPHRTKSNAFDTIERQANGTLRIYDSDKNVIAVFSGVTGYRDISLDYAEQIAKQEVATLWKSDNDGYVSENKSTMQSEWVRPQIPERVNGEKVGGKRWK